MNNRLLRRTAAVGLTLALCLAPAGFALTPKQAGALLEQYYVDPVPAEVLAQTTVEDMLRVLDDPYTNYFTPEEYRAFNDSMRDTSLVGIGIEAAAVPEGLIIEKVFPGSPAEGQEVQPGDLIVAVDGRETAGVEMTQISGWLQGPENTVVEVVFQRADVRRTLRLVRRRLVIPATTVQLEDGHVGVFRCETFGDETLGHFRDGILEHRDSADRWIVDLRDNGGGIIDAAVDTLGLFLGPGPEALLRDRSGQYIFCGTDERQLTPYPMVVLTSPYTASASELFAGAVRDSGCGISVGSRTFGKGVAQSVLDQSSSPENFPDGDAMKITTYRFFAPAGSTTDKVGVLPHLLVPADRAPEVAGLLCGSVQDESTAGMLRLNLGGVWWYLHPGPEDREALTLLLEAVPNGVALQKGTGGLNGWRDLSAEQAAAELGLPYRSRGFSDTAQSPYAQQIDLLATYGLVSGDGTGRFHPEDPLNRAQLCVMLAKALNCPEPRRDGCFSDVPTDSWYADGVNAMAELGIVRGVGGGLFAPESPVTHEQLVAVLGRLVQWISLQFDMAAEQLPDGELEGTQLERWAPWARREVWLLTESQRNRLNGPINLLWTRPEQIDPRGTAAREEAAALLYLLLSYCNIIPV